MPPSGVPARLIDGIAVAGVSGPWVTDECVGSLDKTPGAYLLALRLRAAIDVGLSQAAPGRLAPGWYIYVGSAWGSGGLRARVTRHFQRSKKMHWHIDRLTVYSAEMAALVAVGGRECALVGRLLDSQRFAVALAGFGSTDCRQCESHLLTTAAL